MKKTFLRQMERRNIVFSGISFLVAFIIATALLYTPQVMVECNVDSYEPITTFTPMDASTIFNCTWDETGSYSVSGDDPYIIFNGVQNSGRIIMIKFKEPLLKEMMVQVFRNEGWGFNAGQTQEKKIASGATCAYFVLPNKDYSDFRLDLNGDCLIESVSVGDEGLLEINATNNQYWYLLAFVFSALASVIVSFLDIKIGIAEKLIESFQKNKKILCRNLLVAVFFGIVSVIVSVIICEVVHDIIFKSAKGLYTFAVIAAFVFLLLCGIACIWSCRKNMKQSFEKVFLRMTLIIGFAMIICAPYAHLSWDIDSHYRWALDASYLGNTKLTQSDYLIDLPAYDTLIKDTPDGNYINMAILSFGYNEVIISENVSISLPHLPSGIFIALGRLLGLPFIAIYILGKIPNLLIYTLLCYLGMKQLKDGKLILAIIALFPTNLFLATNYSYDYWVTGFSLFAMAYFVGILQNLDRKVTSKDAFIISACMALACLPKLIYFPLLLIPFFMPQKKIEDKKKYYRIVIILLMVLLALFLLESMVLTTGEGDTRGGSTVNPANQLAYVFGDVWNYASILLRFLFGQYLTFANMENYISNFAYLGVGEGSIIFMVLMFITFLFDKDVSYTKDNRPNWINRGYTIMMYFGGAALMASALYVAFTPVGHETVLGCQARYMIPWIYPLLSIWSMNRIKPIISKNVLCWLVVIGCYGLLFYDIATIFLPSVACLG